MVRGTTSSGAKGKRRTHIRCRRCGSHSFHMRKKRCSYCGFGAIKTMRNYSWLSKP
ncbi:MAG: 50S ribosomal protein L37e [Thaumarchaeota archaeon]|nr:50S ribosomal protein L37e [Nitrososphaerota archaeon]